jgi:hypothetical protein
MVLYRVLLVVLLLVAVLLTLNEQMQERRSREIATGGGPPAVGSGDAYPIPIQPTVDPRAPTATAVQLYDPTPYPAPRP